MDSNFIIFAAVALVILVVLVVLGSKKTNQAARATNSSSGTKSQVWIPENALEEKLEKFSGKEMSRGGFLNALINSQVFVLSDHSEKCSPEHCDSMAGSGGCRNLLIFTSFTQTKKRLRGGGNKFSEVHIIKAKEWVLSLGNSEGIVVNPDSAITVEFFPDDIQKLKFELS